LIRDAKALQKLERVDTVIVDKTGTLTEGKAEVKSIVVLDGKSDDELLRLTASVEQGSDHPIAQSIVKAATARGLKLDAVSNFHAEPGRGLEGTVQGSKVIIGNKGYLAESGFDVPDLPNDIEAAATLIFVGRKGKLAGVIVVGDKIKSSTPLAVKELNNRGVEIVMLTGDREEAAQAVANQLGIKRVEANVLPTDKGEVVNRIKSQGHRVAMAGDGINDAPALSAADVGIAMGNGSDVALEAADIVLVKGDLRGIVKAIGLSRAMMANIRQNLVLAFLYNVLAIPIAAGVLYPAFHIQLNPMIASAAMTLSSISVILNALRLKGEKL